LNSCEVTNHLICFGYRGMLLIEKAKNIRS
jgi:hypothetical protein